MSDFQRVKAAVRIRPLAKKEIDDGAEIIASRKTNNEITINIPGRRNAYDFDWVFGPTSTQLEVYEGVCKGLVINVFQGYNATVFAYGQTGSGKSFTMGTSGNSCKDGIVPYCVKDLFEHRNELLNFGAEVNISFSYMEVYNEECFDLLSSDRQKLDIIETLKKETVVSGLKLIEVENEGQVEKLMTQANLSRSTASTAMNNDSSRSHAIATITVSVIRYDVENQSPNHNTQGGTSPGSNITAKLHLVDLAGSERIKKTQATGEVMKQGININKGLLALGNVITSLAQQSTEKNRAAFVQYRDSKLTRLLKDSLGGNGVTVMLACISPADLNVEETLSTLEFASRAVKVVNRLEVNHVADFSNADRVTLMGEIAALRRENDALRRIQLDYGITSASFTGGPKRSFPSETVHTLDDASRPRSASEVISVPATASPRATNSHSSSLDSNDFLDEFDPIAEHESHRGRYSSGTSSSVSAPGEEDDDDITMTDEEAAQIGRLLQEELRIYEENIDKETNYRQMIAQLKSEIDTLQQDKASLERRGQASMTASKASPEEIERVKKEIRDKSRLLQEKSQELRQREADYAKAKQEKDRAQAEATRLRDQLSEAKSRRAEAQRRLKEESQRHRLEKMNLMKAETALLRAEQQNKLKIVSLERQLEKKDQVLKVQIFEKEAKAEQLRSLLSNKAKVKLVKDKKVVVPKRKAEDMSGVRPSEKTDKFEEERAAVWVKEQVQAHIRRDQLEEEINLLVEARKQTALKLQKVRQEHSTLMDNRRDEESLRSCKLKAQEMNALTEENQKRTTLIAQKQGEIINLGVGTEKRGFCATVDKCNRDPKVALNVMFKMLSKEIPKMVKDLEKKYSDQLAEKDRTIAKLNKNLNHATKNFGGGDKFLLESSDSDPERDSFDGGLANTREHQRATEELERTFVEDDFEEDSSFGEADESFLPEDDDVEDDDDDDDRPKRRNKTNLNRRISTARRISKHRRYSKRSKLLSDATGYTSQEGPPNDEANTRKRALVRQVVVDIGDFPEEPLGKYTVSQLKDFLKAAGLPCTGNKPDLINRLRNNFEQLGSDSPKKRKFFEGGESDVADRFDM